MPSRNDGILLFSHLIVGDIIGGSRGAHPAHAPPFAWHPSSLADLGGRTRCAPPHLPGILVFDDILGHIV